MTIDEIRELIQLVSETGVAELEVQRGDNRVRIRKSFDSESSPLVHTSAPVTAPAAAPAPAPTPGSEPPAGPKSDPQLSYAKSPIVGTFYEAAGPDQPPFVKVGDHVSIGQTLCIVEAMKLMNPIDSEVAGVIESKLVQNGQAVEYGEALFAIRPV